MLWAGTSDCCPQTLPHCGFPLLLIIIDLLGVVLLGTSQAKCSLDVFFPNFHQHPERERSTSLFSRQGYLDSEKWSHLPKLTEQARGGWNPGSGLPLPCCPARDPRDDESLAAVPFHPFHQTHTSDAGTTPSSFPSPRLHPVLLARPLEAHLYRLLVLAVKASCLSSAQHYLFPSLDVCSHGDSAQMPFQPSAV